MEIAEVLTKIAKVVKEAKAKVKTDEWDHGGQHFRKIEVLWIEAAEQKLVT